MAEESQNLKKLSLKGTSMQSKSVTVAMSHVYKGENSSFANKYLFFIHIPGKY